jgi:hypothetical protein
VGQKDALWHSRTVTEQVTQSSAHLECLDEAQRLINTAADREVVHRLLAQCAIRCDDEQTTACGVLCAVVSGCLLRTGRAGQGRSGDVMCWPADREGRQAATTVWSPASLWKRTGVPRQRHHPPQ